MGKMSATEINTISEHIATRLYNEKKEKAIARIENSSEKEFNKLAEEMRQMVKAHKEAEERFKAFKEQWKTKVKDKYHNGKTLTVDYCGRVSTSPVNDFILFGKKYGQWGDSDGEMDEILKLSKTKVVLANLGSELDVEKLIDELRKDI